MTPKDMVGHTPVTVWQALLTMNDDVWAEMIREVFGCHVDYVDVDTVMEKIRETDTCTDLSSPVTVWIDQEGFYTVDVHDQKKEN